MKKNVLLVLSLIFCAGILFTSCNDDDEVTPEKVSFASDIKPIIQTSCAPCHVSGGGTVDLSIYDNAKAHASHIVDYIQLDPSNENFMPLGGSKLSDANISLIKQWQTDGLQP